MHFANSARTARPTPNRIVGNPPTTSGPTAEEKCPEISIQFSCKKLFIPTVAERRRRRHPPGGKLGESRRLASKTPHGQARAAFSTAQPRPFFFPIFRKAGATVRFGCVADSAGVELCGARQDSGPPRAEAAARAVPWRRRVPTGCETCTDRKSEQYKTRYARMQPSCRTEGRRTATQKLKTRNTAGYFCGQT